MLRCKLDYLDGESLAYAEEHIGFAELSLVQAKEVLGTARAYMKKQPADLESLIEELEEIIDDLAFTANPKNGIVMWVDKYAARVEQEINGTFSVDGLMIRAHLDKKHLCVMGTSTDDQLAICSAIEALSGYKCKNMLQSN